MQLTLNRFAYMDACTLGELKIGDSTFSTIERARIGDHPCIPEGEYQLVPHHSPTKGDVYAFVNPTLNVYEYAVPDGETGRCLILLHIANRAAELLGCVAPGLKRGYLHGVNAVLDSALALGQIRGLLKKDSHTVTIKAAS